MQSLTKLILAAIMLAGLTACTETRLAVYGAKQILGPDPGGPVDDYKVGSPYQISGTWYYPAEDPAYDKIGIASWYGPKFHGSLTANGEIYDMDGMTAAHTTLPMPSWVRVTNLDNGRSVLLRVNDRGPFKNNRIIDVSRAAARDLDMIGTGTARVRVTIVKTGGPNGQVVHPEWLASAEGHAGTMPPQTQYAAVKQEPAPSAMPAGDVSAMPINTMPPPSSQQGATSSSASINAAPAATHYIQVGAFVSKQSAERLAGRMTQMFGGSKIAEVDRDGQLLYRVWVGPYRSLDSASGALASLQDTGYSGAHIIRPEQAVVVAQ